MIYADHDCASCVMPTSLGPAPCDEREVLDVERDEYPFFLRGKR